MSLKRRQRSVYRQAERLHLAPDLLLDRGSLLAGTSHLRAPRGPRTDAQQQRRLKHVSARALRESGKCSAATRSARCSRAGIRAPQKHARAMWRHLSRPLPPASAPPWRRRAPRPSRRRARATARAAASRCRRAPPPPLPPLRRRARLRSKARTPPPSGRRRWRTCARPWWCSRRAAARVLHGPCAPRRLTRWRLARARARPATTRADHGDEGVRHRERGLLLRHRLRRRRAARPDPHEPPRREAGPSHRRGAPQLHPRTQRSGTGASERTRCSARASGRAARKRFGP